MTKILKPAVLAILLLSMTTVAMAGDRVLVDWTLSGGGHVSAGARILKGSLGQIGPVGATAGFWPGVRLRGDYADATLPELLRTALHQNHPNPFNPSTTIDYVVGRAGPVSLVVYDLQGRVVRTLVRETAQPGAYSALWRGADDRGRRVASGVYCYALRTADSTCVKKMLLLK